MKKFKNRYGNEYWFEQVEENLFKICGELSYWRFGGKEGQEKVDTADLGFVDPSGGPFITAGYQIEGRVVQTISATDNDIFFEVK